MKTEKSKVLKLKKKFERLTKLHKNQSYIQNFLAIGFLSLLLACFPLSSIPALCMVSLSLSGLMMLSWMGSLIFNINIENALKNKRAKLDDEIEKLIKEDELENQILAEYQYLDKIKNEAKARISGQENLILKLIQKKNSEAEKWQNLVARRTRGLKKNAREIIIKEIEAGNINEDGVPTYAFINETKQSVSSETENANNSETATDSNTEFRC